MNIKITIPMFKLILYFFMFSTFFLLLTTGSCENNRIEINEGLKSIDISENIKNWDLYFGYIFCKI